MPTSPSRACCFAWVVCVAACTHAAPQRVAPGPRASRPAPAHQAVAASSDTGLDAGAANADAGAANADAGPTDADADADAAAPQPAPTLAALAGRYGAPCAANVVQGLTLTSSGRYTWTMRGDAGNRSARGRAELHGDRLVALTDAAHPDFLSGEATAYVRRHASRWMLVPASQVAAFDRAPSHQYGYLRMEPSETVEQLCSEIMLRPAVARALADRADAGARDAGAR